MIGSLGVEKLRTGKALFLVSRVSGKSEHIKRKLKLVVRNGHCFLIQGLVYQEPVRAYPGSMYKVREI